MTLLFVFTYSVINVLIFCIIVSIVKIPKSKIGLYYNIFSGYITTLKQGYFFIPLFFIFNQPWKNHFQEKLTNFIDIRSYADPIFNYEILTESQLKLTINGSAIIKVINPIKAYNSTNDLDKTIDSLCKAELRNHFSKLTAKEIIQTQDLIEQKLTNALNEDLESYGTIVEKFIIGHVNLPNALIKAVESTTAQEAEHRCKLLEIHNQKKLSQQKIKIEELKIESELKYKEKKLQLIRKKVELKNSLKLNFLESLKKAGVNLTEYLKYENFKKEGATIIATNSIEPIVNYHSSKSTTSVKEKDLQSEESILQ